jgi:hypothetical protein
MLNALVQTSRITVAAARAAGASSQTVSIASNSSPGPLIPRSPSTKSPASLYPDLPIGGTYGQVLSPTWRVSRRDSPTSRSPGR